MSLVSEGHTINRLEAADAAREFLDMLAGWRDDLNDTVSSHEGRLGGSLSLSLMPGLRCHTALYMPHTVSYLTTNLPTSGCLELFEMLLHHFILTSLLAPPFSVLGYKIDASCTRQGVEQDVRDGMTGAFAMLDSALGRLRQDPYNDETERLIRLLFLPKPEQSVRQRYLMDKVRDVYTNIDSNYRNEITGTADVPNTDVVWSRLPSL